MLVGCARKPEDEVTYAGRLSWSEEAFSEEAECVGGELRIEGGSVEGRVA